MARDPFYTFIDFVTYNNQLAYVQRQRDQLAERISELDASLASYQHACDTAHEQLNALHKKQHKQELEASQVTQELQTQRNRLERITQPKEYMSLQSEVERLQRQSEEADEAVMEIWQQVEEASDAYHKAQQTYHEAYERIDQERKQLHQQDSEYAQQAQQLEEQMQELRTQVRQEWLDAFDRKRVHVADPAVPVEHGVCSACFFTLPRNELRKLERHVILSCPSCYRLLYIV